MLLLSEEELNLTYTSVIAHVSAAGYTEDNHIRIFAHFPLNPNIRLNVFLSFFCIHTANKSSYKATRGRRDGSA